MPQTARQGVAQAIAEQALSRRSAAAPLPPSKSSGPLPALFDPESSSTTGLTFSNGGATVSSVSSGGSSNTFVLCSAGPFTEGRAAWEFRLDEDTNSQVCVGGEGGGPVILLTRMPLLC